MTRSGFYSCKIPLRIPLIKAAAISSIAIVFLKEGRPGMVVNAAGDLRRMHDRAKKRMPWYIKSDDYPTDTFWHL
jgi:hypothetical protein